MHIIHTSFHRLTLSTTACSVTEPSTCLLVTTRILMWAPVSHLESAELEGLICIFVEVSKVFNESWHGPVWQIRWASCWERHRELRRRRRMLRLKPEAQSRADQHLREPVAEPSAGLSPFLCPFSAFSLSPTHHTLLKSGGNSAVRPPPFHWLTRSLSQRLWQNVSSCRRHMTLGNSKYLVPNPPQVTPAPHKRMELLLMC